MRLRYARQPSDQERTELERMTQQEVGRVALRAQLILLSSQGYPVAELAPLQGWSATTIYQWLDRFDEEGPAGLYDRPRSGRPRSLDEETETEAVIEELLLEPPTQQGYTRTYWTVGLLGVHLEREAGLAVCGETLRTTLQRLDFRWKRPRWAAQRDDPLAAERMQAICQAVIQAPPERLILLEDETTFKSLPPLRQMWIRKGEELALPTPLSNDKTQLYGTLDLHTGQTFHAFSDQALNSEATITYLQQLLAHYQHQSITLIWDHARYHTSQQVQDWIAAQPRLEVLLLPKYDPQLNPVEALWRTLKDHVAANLTRSLAAIKQATHRFFAQHTPHDLLRMAGLLANP